MRLTPDQPNQLPSGATPGAPEGGLTLARACAVIPSRTEDPEGWIHTGHCFPGTEQEVIVSVAAVKEMGRLIGLVDASQYDEALAELERKQDETKQQAEAALELERARDLVYAADQE